MGVLAQADGARGLPEGDLEVLQGEGRPSNGTPNPSLGEPFWRRFCCEVNDGDAYLLQEKMRATPYEKHQKSAVGGGRGIGLCVCVGLDV